jgi:hypothetical protein
MNYELVYKSSLYDISILFISIVIVILCILSYFTFIIKKRREKIISFFMTVLIFSFLYGEIEKKRISRNIQNIISSNTFFTIEGEIKELHIMPKSGHDKESFKINNEYFEISYTGNYPKKRTIYYTLTKNRNGPIKYDGQKVRIDYIKIDGKNKIIAMWVKK